MDPEPEPKPDVCEVGGEGTGPPASAVQAHVTDLSDSWSESPQSDLDCRSQCLPLNTATSMKAQYRWHLIRALFSLIRAMHRKVRDTSSSDASRGAVVEDCRI